MDSAPKGESKYERLRKIGIGSYGIVFKCINRQSGQIVAIKRYSENDSDPVIRKIAMREVRTLRQLKHPNIINLIEIFRRRRRLHLVFDYCELTVLDVIEKYADVCPLNLIKRIVWQIVNGIEYCHSRGCIHRDIKPENILINQSGVVKLCDFGFARSMISKLSGSKSSGSNSSKGNTNANGSNGRQTVEPNQLIGHSDVFDGQATGGGNGGGSGSPERQAMTEYVATRWYRAPELLIGDSHYDDKIDIWAIGCVTAELMRGDPIWPGKTDLDQLNLIQKSLGRMTSQQVDKLLRQPIYDQPSIERLLSINNSDLGPSFSDSLEAKIPKRVGRSGIDFVSSCLCMDPEKRPSSCQLLTHNYIHSSRIEQFITDSSSRRPLGSLSASNNIQTSYVTNSTPIRASNQQSSITTMEQNRNGLHNNNNNTISKPLKNSSHQKQQQQQHHSMIPTALPSLASGNGNHHEPSLDAHESNQNHKTIMSDSKRRLQTIDHSIGDYVDQRQSLVPVATSRSSLHTINGVPMPSNGKQQTTTIRPRVYSQSNLPRLDIGVN